MALLIIFSLITAYAIMLTAFHMKQSRENMILRACNIKYVKDNAALRRKNTELYMKMRKNIDIAEADWISCKAAEKKLEAALKEAKRENAMLMSVNDRLMERLKKVTP